MITVRIYPADRTRADYRTPIESRMFATVGDALDGAEDLLDDVRDMESEGERREGRFVPPPSSDYRVVFVIDGEEMDLDQAAAVARDLRRPVERIDLEQIARAVLGVR